MVQLTSTCVREKEVETHPMGHDVILVRHSDKAQFGLNRAGYCIWQCLEKAGTASAIVDHLLGEFDVSRPECEAQVLDLLDELARQKLVHVT